MSRSLILPEPLLAQIIAEAQQGGDHEICGFIAGTHDHAQVVISVPNVSKSPHHQYEFDHAAMVEAIMLVQKRGQEIVAIYHSHPDSAAKPSVRDITQATWPDVFYLIIGQADQSDIRAWFLYSGHAEEVPLTIPKG